MRNDDQVKEFMNKIIKLFSNKHINSILKSLNLKDDISKLIFNVKNAKNHITHKITIGME